MTDTAPPMPHDPEAAALAAEPPVADYDVILLGAGINGCGTFRDLAAQGLRCLLIEREDICAGASAASSRLMHGGLKYLETGEFRLVRESLYERNMLLTTAAHLVQPLECLVPVRSRFGGILGSVARFLRIKARLTDRGALITRLGLTLYDLYGRSLRRMPLHRMLNRAGLDREMPQLAPQIIGAGVYYEGHITHAERLGLELVLDGLSLSPESRVATHAEILDCREGVIRWRDRDGIGAARAAVVINAGGGWIDAVNRQIGIESHLMGGSRGSHLVLDHPELLAALDGRMVYFGTADGRVNLIYPFMGRVLIGATDIAQGDPDSASCTPEEEHYLRSVIAEIFPDMAIQPGHIVQRICGVRPLPRAEGEVGLVTRDHSIARLSLPGTEIPVLCLIGGKWTTFRAFSEQACDAVLAHLGRTRQVSTRGMAIGGAMNLPPSPEARRQLCSDLALGAGLLPERVHTLLGRYGMAVQDYLEIHHGPESPLPGCADYSREEIAWICSRELVQTTEDVLRRRTLVWLLGQENPTCSASVAEILAETKARILTSPNARQLVDFHPGVTSC